MLTPVLFTKPFDKTPSEDLGFCAIQHRRLVGQDHLDELLRSAMPKPTEVLDDGIV
jgi:hypothetical protein